MTDYKHYALRNLEDWIHDCINAGEASPQEIYHTIKNIVQESYDYHKQCLDNANQLLNLLSGTFQITVTDPAGNLVDCDYDPLKEQFTSNRWVVPVEQFAETDECLITFPDDLMEKVGWKEGDSLNWKDNGDGSFTLTKVVK
jgi:hypothetical protein